MSNNFILKTNLTINNYTIKLYHIENEDIDLSILADSISSISESDLPNIIIEKLENFNGVSKIEIYNTNNELLVSNEKIIL